MSMPIIERPENPIDRGQSINDLIESVALVETGLSHIINAEGEKIQKVIKYDDPTADVPIEDIINVNESAERMINTVSKLEMILQNKLDIAKELDTEPTPGPGPSPTPIASEGALIRYSSGVVVSANTSGNPTSSAVVMSDSPLAINLNGDAESVDTNGHGNLVMTRAGILTDITAVYHNTYQATANTQIVVRLYRADITSKTYTPIDGTLINLTPILPVGDMDGVVTGSLHNLNINLEQDDKIIVVCYCTTNNAAVTSNGAINVTLNIA